MAARNALCQRALTCPEAILETLDALVCERLVDLDPDLGLLGAQLRVVHDCVGEDAGQDTRGVERLRERVRPQVVVEAVEVQERDRWQRDIDKPGRATGRNGSVWIP